MFYDKSVVNPFLKINFDLLGQVFLLASKNSYFCLFLILDIYVSSSLIIYSGFERTDPFVSQFTSGEPDV